MIGRSVCSVAKAQAGRRLSPANVVSLIRCLSSKVEAPKAPRPELKAPEVDSRLMTDAEVRAENARLDSLPSFAEMQAEANQRMEEGHLESGLPSDLPLEDELIIQASNEELKASQEFSMEQTFSLEDSEYPEPELEGEALALYQKLKGASVEQVFETLNSLVGKPQQLAELGAVLSPRQLVEVAAKLTASCADPIADASASFPNPSTPKDKIELYKAEEAAYLDYVTRAKEFVKSYEEKGEPVNITQLALNVKYQAPAQPAVIKPSQAPAELTTLTALLKGADDSQLLVLGHLASASPKTLFYLFAATPAEQRNALFSVVDWKKARDFVLSLSPAQLSTLVSSIDASFEGQIAHVESEARRQARVAGHELPEEGADSSQATDDQLAEKAEEGEVEETSQELTEEDVVMKSSVMRGDHQLARLALQLDAPRLMHLLRSANDDAVNALLMTDQVQEEHPYVAHFDWVANRPIRIVPFGTSRQVVHPSIPADPAPVYPLTMEKKALLAQQRVYKVNKLLRKASKRHDQIQMKLMRVKYEKALANWDGTSEKPIIEPGYEALILRHPDDRPSDDVDYDEAAEVKDDPEDIWEVMYGSDTLKGLDETNPEPEDVIDDEAAEFEEEYAEEGEGVEVEEELELEAEEEAEAEAARVREAEQPSELTVKLLKEMEAFDSKVLPSDLEAQREFNRHLVDLVEEAAGEVEVKDEKNEELSEEEEESEDEAQLQQAYEDELQHIVDQAKIKERAQAKLDAMTPEERKEYLNAKDDDLLEDSLLDAYQLIDMSESEAEVGIGLALDEVSDSDSEQDFDVRMERYYKEIAEHKSNITKLQEKLEVLEDEKDKADELLERYRAGDAHVINSLTAEEKAYDEEVLKLRKVEEEYQIPLKPDRGAADEFIYRAPPGFEPFYLADETPVYEYPRSKVLTEAERQHMQMLKKQGLLKDDWMPSETESEASDNDNAGLMEEKELSQYERQLLKEQWFRERTPPSGMEHATFDRSWIPIVPGALQYDASHLTDLPKPYANGRLGGMGPKDGDYGMIKYTLHCTHFYSDFLDLELAKTLRTIRDHLSSDIRCDPWHRAILDSIEFSLPVRVPVPKHKMTVIRGPFIDKQARNQYEIRWCKSLVSFKVPQFMYPEMIETFERTLQHAIQLSPGLKINVTKTIKDRNFR